MKRRPSLAIARGGAHPTKEGPRSAPPYGRGIWESDAEFEGQRCFKAVNKNGAVVAMTRVEMNLPDLNCLPLIRALQAVLDDTDPLVPDLSLAQSLHSVTRSNK